MGILNNLFIVLLMAPFAFSDRRKGLIPRSQSSHPAVIFPSASRRPQAPNSFDEILVRTAYLRNASEVFAALGIEEGEDNANPISGRGRDDYADPAMCEPELRAVPVNSHGVEVGDVFFPRCVRVLRCGGCCGAGNGMECIPTKITHRDVKLAKIRIRRSTRSTIPQIVKVEVHEECRCMCKVKEEDCDPAIHVYRAGQCNCGCKNEREAIVCRDQAPLKTWDSTECKCKCRDSKHCPTGTEFSQETCNCEAS